jgi:hypothetical protein
MPTEFPTGTRITSEVVDEITDQLITGSEVDTAGVRPVVSSSGTWGLVKTKTFDFKDGYAYKISYQGRVQANSASSTTMYAVELGLLRTNASGTLIHSPGYVTALGNANWANVSAFIIVKVTGGDTTQTIALCGRYSSVNTPTSMDVESSSTSPAILDIEVHGLASDHSAAPELPTA